MSRIPVQFSRVTHSLLLRPPLGLILSLVPKPVHKSNRRACWLLITPFPHLRLPLQIIGLSIGGGVKAVASLLLMEPPSTLKGERRCLIPLLWVRDILCHRAAIAAKEYVFQHHVERGVLDTFALD